MLLDLSVDRQTYVEDCEVCCRPLEISYTADDGEVIALAHDGRPLPFQVTMRRFGRRLDVETLRAELPVAPFFFDVLWCDGEDLLDRPLSERLQRLDDILPPTLRVPRVVPSDLDEAKRFQADALARD